MARSSWCTRVLVLVLLFVTSDCLRGPGTSADVSASTTIRSRGGSRFITKVEEKQETTPLPFSSQSRSIRRGSARTSVTASSGRDSQKTEITTLRNRRDRDRNAEVIKNRKVSTEIPVNPSGRRESSGISRRHSSTSRHVSEHEVDLANAATNDRRYLPENKERRGKKFEEEATLELPHESQRVDRQRGSSRSRNGNEVGRNGDGSIVSETTSQKPRTRSTRKVQALPSRDADSKRSHRKFGNHEELATRNSGRRITERSTRRHDTVSPNFDEVIGSTTSRRGVSRFSSSKETTEATLRSTPAKLRSHSRRSEPGPRRSASKDKAERSNSIEKPQLLKSRGSRVGNTSRGATGSSNDKRLSRTFEIKRETTTQSSQAVPKAATPASGHDDSAISFIASETLETSTQVPVPTSSASRRRQAASTSPTTRQKEDFFNSGLGFRGRKYLTTPPATSTSPISSANSAGGDGWSLHRRPIQRKTTEATPVTISNEISSNSEKPTTRIPFRRQKIAKVVLKIDKEIALDDNYPPEFKAKLAQLNRSDQNTGRGAGKVNEDPMMTVKRHLRSVDQPDNDPFPEVVSPFPVLTTPLVDYVERIDGSKKRQSSVSISVKSKEKLANARKLIKPELRSEEVDEADDKSIATTISSERTITTELPGTSSTEVQVQRGAKRSGASRIITTTPRDTTVLPVVKTYTRTSKSVQRSNVRVADTTRVRKARIEKSTEKPEDKDLPQTTLPYAPKVASEEVKTQTVKSWILSSREKASSTKSSLVPTRKSRAWNAAYTDKNWEEPTTKSIQSESATHILKIPRSTKRPRPWNAAYIDKNWQDPAERTTEISEVVATTEPVFSPKYPRSRVDTKTRRPSIVTTTTERPVQPLKRREYRPRTSTYRRHSDPMPSPSTTKEELESIAITPKQPKFSASIKSTNSSLRPARQEPAVSLAVNTTGINESANSTGISLSNRGSSGTNDAGNSNIFNPTKTTYLINSNASLLEQLRSTAAPLLSALGTKTPIFSGAYSTVSTSNSGQRVTPSGSPPRFSARYRGAELFVRKPNGLDSSGPTTPLTIEETGPSPQISISSPGEPKVITFYQALESASITNEVEQTSDNIQQSQLNSVAEVVKNNEANVTNNSNNDTTTAIETSVVPVTAVDSLTIVEDTQAPETTTTVATSTTTWPDTTQSPDVIIILPETTEIIRETTTLESNVNSTIPMSDNTVNTVAESLVTTEMNNEVNEMTEAVVTITEAPSTTQITPTSEENVISVTKAPIEILMRNLILTTTEAVEATTEMDNFIVESSSEATTEAVTATETISVETIATEAMSTTSEASSTTSEATSTTSEATLTTSEATSTTSEATSTTFEATSTTSEATPTTSEATSTTSEATSTTSEATEPSIDVSEATTANEVTDNDQNLTTTASTTDSSTLAVETTTIPVTTISSDLNSTEINTETATPNIDDDFLNKMMQRLMTLFNIKSAESRLHNLNGESSKSDDIAQMLGGFLDHTDRNLTIEVETLGQMNNTVITTTPEALMENTVIPESSEMSQLSETNITLPIQTETTTLEVFDPPLTTESSESSTSSNESLIVPSDATNSILPTEQITTSQSPETTEISTSTFTEESSNLTTTTVPITTTTVPITITTTEPDESNSTTMTPESLPTTLDPNVLAGFQDEIPATAQRTAGADMQSPTESPPTTPNTPETLTTAPPSSSSTGQSENATSEAVTSMPEATESLMPETTEESTLTMSMNESTTTVEPTITEATTQEPTTAYSGRFGASRLTPAPRFSSSSSTLTPLRDYHVYGIYPNKTIVRKRPEDNLIDARNVDSPYVIFGIYPDGKLVRKYPNGTVIPDPPSQPIEVVFSLSTTTTTTTTSTITNRLSSVQLMSNQGTNNNKNSLINKPVMDNLMSLSGVNGIRSQLNLGLSGNAITTNGDGQNQSEGSTLLPGVGNVGNQPTSNKMSDFLLNTQMGTSTNASNEIVGLLTTGGPPSSATPSSVNPQGGRIIQNRERDKASRTSEAGGQRSTVYIGQEKFINYWNDDSSNNNNSRVVSVKINSVTTAVNEAPVQSSGMLPPLDIISKDQVTAPPGFPWKDPLDQIFGITTESPMIRASVASNTIDEQSPSRFPITERPINRLNEVFTPMLNDAQLARDTSITTTTVEPSVSTTFSTTSTTTLAATTSTATTRPTTISTTTTLPSTKPMTIINTSTPSTTTSFSTVDNQQQSPFGATFDDIAFLNSLLQTNSYANSVSSTPKTLTDVERLLANRILSLAIGKPGPTRSPKAIQPSNISPNSLELFPTTGSVSQPIIIDLLPITPRTTPKTTTTPVTWKPVTKPVQTALNTTVKPTTEKIPSTVNSSTTTVKTPWAFPTHPPTVKTTTTTTTTTTSAPSTTTRKAIVTRKSSTKLKPTPTQPPLGFGANILRAIFGRDLFGTTTTQKPIIIRRPVQTTVKPLSTTLKPSTLKSSTFSPEDDAKFLLNLLNAGEGKKTSAGVSKDDEAFLRSILNGQAKIKAPEPGSTPASEAALLAALLKAQGIEPATPVNNIRDQLNAVSNGGTTNSPKTAPRMTTTRPRPSPTSTYPPPLFSNFNFGNERPRGQSADDSDGVQNQMLNAAIGATRVFSQFLGAAITGAAQQLQSFVRNGTRIVSEVVG